MSQYNSRLLYQDVLADVGSTSAGDSEIVDLDGASKFSCQAVYDVQAPDAKTFDSPELATLVDQSLTYTAVDAGAAGNDITIEYVDTGVPLQALEVSVDGDAITVNLELDAGTASTLVDQDLTYTAVLAGVAGDEITIEYVDTGVPSQALEVNVVGSAISVNLELDAGTASTLIEQDLTYTAQEVGVAGDLITITYEGDGVSGAETVDVTGTDIVVHMDPTAVTGSTADDILAAIEASVAADALVAVVVSGTGANVQAASAETPLAGGVDPAIVSTGDEVKAAVNGDDPGAADLVLVSGTQAGVVTALAATPLSGGVDPAIVSTGDDVKAAVNGDSPGAADLVLVSGSNASPVTALEPTPLAGGSDGEVNVEDSEITIPSHGFPEGFKVRLTTTGTLPAPLLTATDYFVIVIDANTIQLAESLAEALAGTEIELTDAGSDDAVHTVTGVALAGASVTFKKSNNMIDWVTIQSATSITVDGSVMLEQANVSYRYFMVTKALTSGVVDLQANVLVIGDAQ